MINGSLKVALVLGAVAALGGIGCGSDRPDWEPSDPDEQVAAIKESLTKPSGTVDATSVKSVLGLYGDIAKSNELLTAAMNVNGPNIQACIDGDTSGGTIDLDCASGGKVTGTLEISIDGEVSASGRNADVLMEIELDACKGSLCVSSSVVIKAQTTAESSSSTIVYSADITEGDKTTHLFFGMDASASADAASAKIVVYDAKGRSYVFNASATAEGSSFSIEGANGAFSCTSTAEAGSCTGAAEFNF